MAAFFLVFFFSFFFSSLDGSEHAFSDLGTRKEFRNQTLISRDHDRIHFATRLAIIGWAVGALAYIRDGNGLFILDCWGEMINPPLDRDGYIGKNLATERDINSRRGELGIDANYNYKNPPVTAAVRCDFLDPPGR